MKKIQVVKDWPTLETVSDVRSFLGFVGYYRRFIKGFSQIAKPLYQLTKGIESQTKRTAKKTKFFVFLHPTATDFFLLC